MKAHVIRNKRGQAVASILEAEAGANLVPLDAELDDEEAPQMEEVRLRTRDLFDLDALHKRLGK